jgi:Ca2+-transporting ATPase
MRTLRQIFDQFPQTRHKGLSEAEANQSLQQNGANRLTPLPREPLWKKFLGKFDEAIIKILLAATLLKTVVDLFENDSVMGSIGLGLVAVSFFLLSVLKLSDWIPSAAFGLSLILVGMSIAIGHPSYEGLAVMIAIVLATGVAFYSEMKSDREFEILNSQKESIGVKVRRGGEVHLLPLEEIVVGDCIELEMGDEIPADGRVTEATELYIDQSLMTGESEPVKKAVRPDDDPGDGPDQPACVYRGTQVVDGKGEMIVTEVGDLTMIGQIARRLSAEPEDDDEGAEAPETEEKRVQKKLTISKELTPLQQKLTSLADTISKVGYIAAIAIFLALLGQGIFKGDVSFESANISKTISNLLSYFVYMVIIIVVAVPEGLPMSVTVSLALAMRKMTRANSLVRQLVACETIGSATVICSDKTGTLTQNKMQVERVGFDEVSVSRSTDWPKPASSLSKPVDWIAFNSIVNSTANLEKSEGKLKVIGNSTEGALLLWANEAGLDYIPIRESHPLLYQLHFSSERKRMTSVVERDGKMWALMKGAPEIVMADCTQFLSRDGVVRELTESTRGQIQKLLREAAGEAMRTLAFAYRELPAGFPRDESAIHERRSEMESNLVFAGFVAIRDPLRPDVKEAVQKCREAGIEVKMITGDNIETAKAIGRDIGLLDAPNAIAMTSDEFNRLNDEQLKATLPDLRILARARPLDKFRIVKLLQEQDHVVAVTGDGTNDAPALKKADVGLAMGIAGTEVAKEASKIVLLDDSFSTIVKAVHWGRSLYENIQRFIQFQLTINVSALLIAFLGPFLGIKPPFTVLQLLWINVIMDTFAAIALCSEPPRDGLMRMKPKRRDESIVTPSMLKTILSTAMFFVVVMVVLLLGMKHGEWFAQPSQPTPKDWEFVPLTMLQVTLFFSVYIFFQVWNQINCRSLTPESSGFKGLFANTTFLTILILIIIGQLVIVTFGGSIFKVQPLEAMQWMWVILSTASVLIFAEVVRRIRKASGGN